jgi:hypothetical protein
MSPIQQFVPALTRRVLTCTFLTVAAVLTVALWASKMDGDAGQSAAMLGATIAATTAAVGPGRCRPAHLWRRRRLSER